MRGESGWLNTLITCYSQFHDDLDMAGSCFLIGCSILRLAFTYFFYTIILLGIRGVNFCVSKSRGARRVAGLESKHLKYPVI